MSEQMHILTSLHRSLAVDSLPQTLYERNHDLPRPLCTHVVLGTHHASLAAISQNETRQRRSTVARLKAAEQCLRAETAVLNNTHDVIAVQSP